MRASIVPILFQSLFSWMPAGNPANQERGLDGLLFQSLFSWMPAGNTLNRWRRLNMRWSFNPCSRGCLPETRRTESSMSRHCRFQSLFSWMPAGNFAFGDLANMVTRVSILVLVDACRKPGIPRMAASAMASVSILVLVDACRKRR